MRAMILAAGRGERLRPLTDTTPKPLIDAGGRSLIEWHIDSLKQAGITDIVINTAWLDRMIHDALGDGSTLGVSITYSDEGTALETAGGIVEALPILGDEPFIVINGDIWCDLDLSTLPQLADDTLAHLILVENPDHNPAGDFAIEGGYLRNDGDPMYTFSGIGMYRPSMFCDLDRGARKLAPLLRGRADADQISASLHQGAWTDVGTIDRLEELRERLS